MYVNVGKSLGVKISTALSIFRSSKFINVFKLKGDAPTRRCAGYLGYCSAGIASREAPRALKLQGRAASSANQVHHRSATVARYHYAQAVGEFLSWGEDHRRGSSPHRRRRGTAHLERLIRS
jgi:hypothetical protein